jgi:phage pi2 protein 07
MKCPQCKKELELITPQVWRNVDTYHRTVVAKTKCCKKLILVSPRFEYNISVYRGDKTVDDWGN